VQGYDRKIIDNYDWKIIYKFWAADNVAFFVLRFDGLFIIKRKSAVIK